MRRHLTIAAILAAGCVSIAAQAENKPVGITADLMSVKVTHGGQEVDIQRNQDNTNTVIDAFAKTSRPCPPFCIQPIKIAEGVETLGEIELLDYVAKMNGGDTTILLIDSRTPDWVERGTIPSAVNLPWTGLAPSKGATTAGITKIMTDEFAVKLKDGVDEIDIDEAIVNNSTSDVFDFSSAKTLVLFCNGMWCGQSPTNIKALLKYGYPPEKIKWYRGGMQAWEILGFKSAKP